MKKVRETSAGKSISAYVIMKGARHVATVQVYFGSAVIVDVWQEGAAIDRTLKAYKMGEEKRDNARHQQGRACGYGYDKFTAALSGIVIDGHKMSDHCGTNAQTKRLLAQYKKARAKAGDNIDTRQAIDLEFSTRARKIGARFANWGRDGEGWTSLYLQSGLDRLRDIGYNVISAI